MGATLPRPSAGTARPPRSRRSAPGAATHPAQLARQIGPGPALATLAGDRLGEGTEGPGEPLLVGCPAPTSALLEPFHRAAVPPAGVAPTAGRDLVLQP